MTAGYPLTDVDKKPSPGIMEFAGLGLMNAVCLGGGLVVGWLVDRSLGTLPLFMFVGLLLGIVAGVLATRASWKRFF
ncbi:MAG TPA: AtpZ/AtpI family protein [Acidimicrobiales bacterium]|nr:AtpZ/AtpI family protein [Acidimicrobiales bacterium]